MPDKEIAQTATGKPYELLMIVTPQSSLTGVTLFIDALRAVNRVSGIELFKWRIATANGKAATASNNFPIPADCSLQAALVSEHVVLFASYELPAFGARPIGNFLRKAVRHGSVIIGIDQGAVLFASLGLLDGYRATTHWEVVPSLVERFPKVRFVEELFVEDRGRITCAGHTACLDLALHLAETRYGKSLALLAAAELIYDRIRPGALTQRVFDPTSISALSAPLGSAIAIMNNHLGDPLSIAQIASAVSISTRQLESHFQMYLKVSPLKYYLRLRLCHARKLLLYSSMKIGDVSTACGFSSQGSFTRAFSVEFRATPSTYRRNFLDTFDRPYVVHQQTETAPPESIQRH